MTNSRGLTTSARGAWVAVAPPAVADASAHGVVPEFRKADTVKDRTRAAPEVEARVRAPSTWTSAAPNTAAAKRVGPESNSERYGAEGPAIAFRIGANGHGG
jgi:hypothetical protein